MSENNLLDKDDLNGSQYLYSDKNRDLYLKTFKEKTCPQEKKVFLLLDKDESEHRLNSLVNHVNECEVCKLKLKNLRKFNLQLDMLIPKPTISRSAQLEFEGQLQHLIKEFSFSVKSIDKEFGFWEKLKRKVFS